MPLLTLICCKSSHYDQWIILLEEVHDQVLLTAIEEKNVALIMPYVHKQQLKGVFTQIVVRSFLFLLF